MLRRPPSYTLYEAVSRTGLARFLGPQVASFIHAALDMTERWELRRRLMPMDLVMYLVLAAVLFRSLSLDNVWRQLMLGLQVVLPDGRLAPSDSTILESRYRLGFEPARALFRSIAGQVEPPSTFHGYRVHAMDGVRIAVADTPENEVEFGRPRSGRGRTSRPVVRVVVLATAYSHEVEGIDVAGWKTPEQDAVEHLMRDADLAEDDLVVLDRLYPSGPLFHMFEQAGVKVVARISSTWKPRIVKTLRPGDYVVEISAKIPLTSDEVAALPRRKGRQRKYNHLTIRLRMICYTCGGNETIRLLTNLPEQVPAIDIARLYRERWEIELINDEIKNHLATPLYGSEKLCFRSKFPEGVKQEIYSTFAVHLTIRQTIRTAASMYGLAPLELSFTDSLNTIRRYLCILQFGDESVDPAILQALYYEVATQCKLRQRRTRQYPRKVKVKMSDFECKKTSDHETKVDHLGLTTLAEPAPHLARSA